MPSSLLPALDPTTDAPWLLVALLGACAVALWVAVARLGAIERRLQGGARGEGQAGAPAGQSPTGALELRRVEQLLTEIRDGSKRLEDALLRAQTAGRPLAGADSALVQAVDLGERVTNRLLALGYDRVVVVTPREQFEAILRGGGEVLVEARRDGAACKGKAVFRGGVLTDVAMQSAYATFP